VILRRDESKDKPQRLMNAGSLSRVSHALHDHGVIPAKAGIQYARANRVVRSLDSRFRGNDSKRICSFSAVRVRALSSNVSRPWWCYSERSEESHDLASSIAVRLIGKYGVAIVHCTEPTDDKPGPERRQS
jgi:hypothetical protein